MVKAQKLKKKKKTSKKKCKLLRDGRRAATVIAAETALKTRTRPNDAESRISQVHGEKCTAH